MIRWLQVLSVIAAAGAAVFVFQVKYRAEAVAEHAAQLQRELDQENETKSLLAAEWSLLIQPARVQDAGRPPRRAAEAAAARSGADHQDREPADATDRTRAGRCGGAFGDPRNAGRTTVGGCAMTAIIPASAWRHQRGDAVDDRAAIRSGAAACRVMLAMLGFGLLYGALATRLVLLGDRRARRGGRRRDLHPRRFAGAPRHHRPERRDARHRHPHRLALRRAALRDRPGRGDRAPRLRASRPRSRAAAADPLDRREVRLHQARDHAAPAAGDPQARHSGHRLPRREPALLSRRARRPRMCSAPSTSTTRASPASRNISTARS